MKFLKALFIIIVLMMSITTEAQIWKKITKKAGEKAAKVAAKKVSQQTEKTIEGIAEGKRKKKKRKKSETEQTTEKVYAEKIDGGFNMYSKFDFVPGNQILFYDDFSIDNIGDFPSKWDGNGAGELVQIGEKKWLKLSSKTTYLPVPISELPEEFTIEFDMHATNYVRTGGRPGAKFWFWIDDNTSYNQGRNWAGTSISFWTAIKTRVRIKNKRKGKSIINNMVEYDELSNDLFDPVHVSVAVNKRRMRLWINEKKIVDVPRLVPEANWKAFKFNISGYDDPFLVSNFKVATGNRDLRAELINKGSFTTNAIQFDSGSAVIKASSYGALKQIANALQQDNFMIHIIGHTDNDGDEQTNIELSEKRALAVKNALVTSFNIDETLLSTEGVGSTSPIADNSIAEGKAQNRRVEFVKN